MRSRITIGRREKLDALARINVHQSELFAHLLGKMDAIKEGGGTLLDHSLIMYGSTLSNPTMHSQRNLPIILAGGAAGRVKGGRHLSHEGEPPLTNLYLSMLDKIGVPTEKLGDSTGKLNRLEVWGWRKFVRQRGDQHLRRWSYGRSVHHCFGSGCAIPGADRSGP